MRPSWAETFQGFIMRCRRALEAQFDSDDADAARVFTFLDTPLLEMHAAAGRPFFDIHSESAQRKAL